jgi:hypothetical protein
MAATRWLEWFLALQAVALGAWIAAPGASMGGAGYAALIQWAPEGVYGAFFCAAGGAHAAALVINGAQARATTAARAAITALSVVAWAALAWGFYLADPGSTAVASNLGQACAAAVAYYRALRDAMRARRGDQEGCGHERRSRA